MGYLRREFPDGERLANYVIQGMREENPKFVKAIIDRVSKRDYSFKD